jgi:flagellar basal body-associated protein FliL
VQQIKQRDPQLQDAILQKLASLLAGELDGNKLKQALYDLYTQAKYTTAK